MRLCIDCDTGTRLSDPHTHTHARAHTHTPPPPPNTWTCPCDPRSRPQGCLSGSAFIGATEPLPSHTSQVFPLTCLIIGQKWQTGLKTQALITSFNNEPQQTQLSLSLSLSSSDQTRRMKKCFRWAGQAARMGDVRTVSLHKYSNRSPNADFIIRLTRCIPPLKKSQNSLSAVRPVGQSVQKIRPLNKQNTSLITARVYPCGRVQLKRADTR